MKHIILSLKMKGDAISDHFLMLWFQKDSKKIQSVLVLLGLLGGDVGLGNFPKFDHFFSASPSQSDS